MNITLERTVSFRRAAPSRTPRPLDATGSPTAAPVAAPGRLPRIARLLALAHRFDALVRSGAVRDYAELARLGRVSRARISQIMSLLSLAPDLQEEILFLSRVERGRDPVQMHHLLAIVRALDWAKQRAAWTALKSNVGLKPTAITKPV